MIYELKNWWKSERYGRVEEGTSQDYCSTNGGAVCYALFWCGISAAFFLIGISGV